MSGGVTVGQLVAGKYRIDRVLGEGGMGVVVRATHVTLEQPVAIKLLREEVRDKPAIVERFAREAKALAKLTSEHVTHVIDVANLDDGSPYIVMECLDGEDLATVVERDGALPLATTVRYVLEACEAVAEAHSVRVVHRDLKPANLFLARRPGEDRPAVKVLDFGISKLLDDETSLTKTAAGLGSALYMAPEQMRNAKDCDERADVWALGVILYELLSGRVPFGGESVHQVVANVLDQNRQRLSVYVPSLPEDIDRLVEECLVLDPKKRVRSVLAIAERLAPFGPPDSKESLDRVRRFLGAEPSSAVPVVPSIPIVVTHAAESDPTPSRRLEMGSAKTEEHAITLPSPAATTAPSGPSWRTVAAVAAVVAAMGGIGMFVVKTRAGASDRPSPVPAAEEAPSSSHATTAPPSPSVAPTAAPEVASVAPVVSHSATAPDRVAPKKGEKPIASAPTPVAPASVVAAPVTASATGPAPSAKPASTGGIVPISTMGIK